MADMYYALVSCNYQYVVPVHSCVKETILFSFARIKKIYLSNTINDTDLYIDSVITLNNEC